MSAILRRLALGLFLIAAASALLLSSDLGSRISETEAGSESDGRARIAILQQVSQAVLDEGQRGILAGLAERGWIAGKNLDVRRYNAEGDMPVAQAIAKEMTAGGNDLLVTISTPSLQAVANANRSTHIPHVFALVTDPVAAGVGVHREDPLDHPAWLAGYGTMQPVAEAFEVALKMNPSLKKIGVVWNASEANSEAQIKVARAFCAGHGLTLMEATVENSAGVSEAAASLVARGAEALWVSGDVTVITAIDAVVAAARKNGIPVFTVIPPNVKRGALFDLGADYFEVGRLSGVLAGDILHGQNPADLPIHYALPKIQTLNLQALKGLKGSWKIPDAIRKSARLVIDENGVPHEKSAPVPAPSAPGTGANPNPTGKKWKIALILYTESPPSEDVLRGMAEGWKKSPLIAGRDYTLKVRNAQGDMAMLGGIVDAALGGGADILVPLSTPALQATIQKARDVPVVFSMVANPVVAGAGKSATDHLPNVTGVSVMGPFEDMLDLLQKYYPSYQKIGTLYCPAEANSVDLKDALEAACIRRGLVLESVAANSSGELMDAALSLASRPIDAIVQISDNLSTAGFAAITKAARQTRKPLFSLNSTTVPQGSPISMGRDYHAAGAATVPLIEKVIQGVRPGSLPFLLPPRVVLVVSLPNARELEMTIPEGLLKEADTVIR